MVQDFPEYLAPRRFDSDSVFLTARN